MIKAFARPGQDRLRLDVGVERATQGAARFETLTVERNAVRERRLAQRGELLRWDIPQVNRSELLAGQRHDIFSPANLFMNCGAYTRATFVTDEHHSL